VNPTDPTHLHQLLRHLAGGDRAFLFHFVDCYEQPVGALLRRAGVATVEVAPMVHEVALVVMDLAVAAPTHGDPWVLVERAVRLVAVGDPGGSPTAAQVLHRRADDGFSGRSLHLVDIENLAGGPSRVGQWFSPAVREYLAVAEPGDADQMITAADVTLWRRTAFDVPIGRYLPGRGPDGADRALLAAAPADWVAQRFDRLVIGSGDQAFADLARAVRPRGTQVVVVARPRQLAGSLRRAADVVVALPNLPDLPDLPLSSDLPDWSDLHTSRVPALAA